jgi:UDP-N-acetyl-D-mannosaminuronate dehydrogenase
VHELRNFFDRYKLISKKDFKKKNKIKFTTDSSELKNCNFFIVTVPTPVKKNNTPDMSYLIKACTEIAVNLIKGSFVFFESTVYPGATRDVCIPILEKYSGLKFKKDFFIRYTSRTY